MTPAQWERFLNRLDQMEARMLSRIRHLELWAAGISACVTFTAFLIGTKIIHIGGAS